ncbi:hypothetical protein BS50DRAFT_576951, partial [Corynespora cassiicola Philippines]
MAYRGCKRPGDNPTIEIQNIDTREEERGPINLPIPFLSIRLIFYKDTCLMLWSAASPYAVWYCIQASIPISYHQIYGYNDLLASFYSLSGGVVVIVGGFVAGRLMDCNFKRVSDAVGFTANHVSMEEMPNFPIEKSRSRGWYIWQVFSICASAGYGWAVHYRVHPSVPLILQFFLGLKCTVILQIYSTLVVDIFPGNNGAASASNNITRSTLSAVLVAILEVLQV